MSNELEQLDPDEEFDLETRMDSVYLENWFSRLDENQSES